jgi:hypothetical protein
VIDKKISAALLVLAMILSFGMQGCSAYGDAQNSVQVIGGIVSLAQADMPELIAAGAFTAAEGATVQQWLTGLATLDTQAATCVQAAHVAGDKKVAFLACFTIFANGLVTPAELALFRVMNPKAQQKIQLWVTAATLAFNAIIAILGGTALAAPTVAANPASHQELADFGARLNLGQYGL